MAKVRLQVAYDGTGYLGWQKTKMGPSIEAELEKALSQFLQEEVQLNAISRTDAGVHAKAQCVQFETNREELGRLQKSLNSMLPSNIGVWDLEIIPQFKNAVNKTYCYYVCNSEVQLPHHRHYSWHVREPLNLDTMRNAATQIQGEQDFAAFCNVKKNEEYESTIRNLMELQINPLPNQRLEILMIGNSFLYKMARNIAGTLINIGMGRMDANIEALIENKDRTALGVTAPAHGLFLTNIELIDS